MKSLYLGIDVGSVSANTVIMDDRQNVLEEHYTRIKGQPLQTVQKVLKEILQRIPLEQFHSVSFTGTGGKLLSELLVEISSTRSLPRPRRLNISIHRSGRSLISEERIRN